MSLLVDLAPREVVVAGQCRPINWDFRHGLLFELMMLDDSLTSTQKSEQALRLYYPTLPADTPAALEQIHWFWRCGKPPADAGKEATAPKTYDYEADDVYIYAAFLADYGIDLNTAEGLHWWKFRAMFSALKPDNLFCKIVEWRSTPIEDVPKGQRAFYRKMKKLYGLPVPLDERERQDKIKAALMGDGDLSALL